MNFNWGIGGSSSTAFDGFATASTTGTPASGTKQGKTQMDTVKVWRVLLSDAISKGHMCYRRIPVYGRRYFGKNA
ncbi:MAG: hypothetical protein IJE97_12790 [Thermoguttaceae bacterium]|nr:hypothetical protein [Thermoguttaceae bacterium]